MPLIDGVKIFAAEHAPDLRREKQVVPSKKDLIKFCMDFNLPMFRMEKVVFKDRLVEKKTDLNMLFTPFKGIWVMAYEDAEEGEKDGQ